MGFSSVVVEGIILVAAVIAASVFAATFMGKVFEVKDALAQMAKRNVEHFKLKVVVVYATYNNELGCFLVFAKNVGKIPVKPIEEVSIFFGTLGKAEPYYYNPSPTYGQWTYVEHSTVNGIWELGETVEFRIYNQTNIETPYYVKLILPQGGFAEEMFSEVIR